MKQSSAPQGENEVNASSEPCAACHPLRKVTLEKERQGQRPLLIAVSEARARLRTRMRALGTAVRAHLSRRWTDDELPVAATAHQRENIRPRGWRLSNLKANLIESRTSNGKDSAQDVSGKLTGRLEAKAH